MREIKWSDELGHRSRRPWLLLVKDGRVIEFGGKSIPGVVAVLGSDYHQNGKWSHSVFRLALADGVRPVAGLNGWETGHFEEGLRAALSSEKPLDRWGDLSKALGVSIEEAQRFVRTTRPKCAERLDAVESALATL